MTIHCADDQPEKPHRGEYEDAFDNDDAIAVAGKFPTKHVDEENERPLLIPDISVGHATLCPHPADELEEILIRHQA